MQYSKVKRIFDILSGVFAILAAMGTVCGAMLWGTLGYEWTRFLPMAVAHAILGIPLLVFGIILTLRPKKKDDRYRPRNAMYILIVVYCAVLLALMFACSPTVDAAYDRVLAAIRSFDAEYYRTLFDNVDNICSMISVIVMFSLLTLGFTVTAMVLKTEKKAPIPSAAEQQDLPVPVITPITAPDEPTADSSIKQKIDQLKEWHDAGVITDEQYALAVGKLMDRFID